MKKLKKCINHKNEKNINQQQKIDCYTKRPIAFNNVTIKNKNE